MVDDKGESSAKVLTPDEQRFRQDLNDILRQMPYQGGSVVLIHHYRDGQSRIIAVVASKIDLKSQFRLAKDGRFRECVRDQFTSPLERITFHISSKPDSLTL
jgi:hypothetical protein